MVAAVGDSAFMFGHLSGAALALIGPAVEGPVSEAAERFLALVGTSPQVIGQMRAGPHWAYMESFAATLPYDLTLCNGGSVR